MQKQIISYGTSPNTKPVISVPESKLHSLLLQNKRTNSRFSLNAGSQKYKLSIEIQKMPQEKLFLRSLGGTL